MKYSIFRLLTCGISFFSLSIFVHAQQNFPSNEAIDKAMQEVQRKATNALRDAQIQSQSNGKFPQRQIPNFESPPNLGKLDPAQLAESYKNLKMAKDDDAPEMMVFVSLSMPPETLQRIGTQARKAGAVVVFRGLKHGITGGGWNRSLQALQPITATGADVQIHPELFTRYNVTGVPTVVVASEAQTGCQEDTCATKAAAVVGDVSLDYALEQLSERTDRIGTLAKARLDRLKNR